MTKEININLKQNSYKIVIGKKMLFQLGPRLKKLNIGHDAVIISHPIIDKYYGAALKRGLKRNGFSVTTFLIPAGERSKSARTALCLMEKIARIDTMKQIFMIALGGGVIGDLVGFVAAAYKRGVPYIQVPTTFLAQIDSAIGGKVAVDLSVGKNLVGAFYQPKIVWSDISVLATLSKRQLRNGLAEAVKYGVIQDRNLFRFLTKNYPDILSCQPKILTNVIFRCSQIKTKIVMRDEKETKGIRTILNFGHTIGHAIEAAGKYRVYHHGEAIALGMRVAAEISYQLKMMKHQDVIDLHQLLDAIGLPKNIHKVRLRDILDIMKHDKKFLAGKNRFVLARRIGQVKVVEGVSLKVIRNAVKKIM